MQVRNVTPEPICSLPSSYVAYFYCFKNSNLKHGEGIEVVRDEFNLVGIYISGNKKEKDTSLYCIIMNLQFLVGSLYKSFKGKSGIVSTHNF
jgi:hypothetical protein